MKNDFVFMSHESIDHAPENAQPSCVTTPAMMTPIDGPNSSAKSDDFTQKSGHGLPHVCSDFRAKQKDQTL